MMFRDTYVEDDTRIVLFKFKRYRVTKSTITSSYSIWYSGNLIDIDDNRQKIIQRFKDAIANVSEATA